MSQLRKVLQVRRNLLDYPLRHMSEVLNKDHVSHERSYEEVKIPGPWGNVIGKWWGPQDKRPILGLHGWQDNCGTFDKLAPYLPPHVPFLAIDLPGHGLSSKIPSGVFYHGIDIAVFVRRLVKYFNWPKVSLLGHSMGAMSNFAYALIYPEDVDFLICIDGLYPFSMDKHRKAESMAKTISDFLKYDALSDKDAEPPSYTFPELEQLLHKGSKNSIDVESCKYILRRNVAPSTTNPERFYFTRDPRLKVASLLQWTREGILEGAQRITCPVFMSMGKSSPFLLMKEDYTEVLNVIRKQNRNVEYHEVDGTHHLHLNNPENVQALINAFIEKHDVEDRSNCGLKQEMRLKL